MESRIGLNDTPIDAIVKLSEGVPGAVVVLTGLLKNAEAVDPDSALGPIGPMLFMDTLHIYGSRIWMLYKDVCGQHIGHVIAMLRAVQLGLLPEARLQYAIDNRGADVDITEILDLLQTELPSFNPNAVI